MDDLRRALEAIVRDWGELGVAWDNEDRKNFEDRTALGKVNPDMFLSTTRVIILNRCRDVLRHALEAYK